MYSIIYRSKAKPDFERIDIYKMLSAARDNNAILGITGCLLYHKNHFLQLLEGEKNAVTKLYQSILNDTRHSDILTLAEKEISRPIFIDWSMAFHDFESNDNGAYRKSLKMDAIFEKSNAFDQPSKMALSFFKSVNEILFVAN